jgi:hypothetical protein
MSSKEQMRSSVRVWVQGGFIPKGGQDQGATTDHPWGLRRKDQTSCEKTPYLDREDDDAKMTKMMGHKSRMSREATSTKMGLNRAGKGPGRPAHADQPSPFMPHFAVPFDLAPLWSICSSCLRWPPHRIIPSTPIHQKVVAARWGRELDEFVARINTGVGKETRGLQAVGLGVSPSFITPSLLMMFSGGSITPMCFNLYKMIGNASVYPYG